MLIDCDTCRAPREACRDCVMTTLLQVTDAPIDFDDTERAALGSLAQAGLVPPLRLVVAMPSGFVAGAEPPAADHATRQDRPRSTPRAARRGIA